MGRSITRTMLKKEIWDKTNGICAHCGKYIVSNQRTIDHYIPRLNGGGFDKRNLMPLCLACNMCRGSKDVEPRKFYSYASESDIDDCLIYKRIWRGRHITMSGDIW